MTVVQRVELWLIVVVAILSIFTQGYFDTQSDQTPVDTKDTSEETHQQASGNKWLRDEDISDENLSGDHRLHQRESASNALAPRDEQIARIENELEELRFGRLEDGQARVHRSKKLLDEAKSNAGWIFKSAEDKGRIERLDAEHNRNLKALAEVKADEKALEARIKPLYGIVSAPFYIEQRRTISSCVSKVQEVAYNQAWYSGLFNIGRAESISDLLIQFLLEWVMTYIFMYPFAVAYYALWAAPWSIYEYSSGVVDIVPAVIVWVLGVGAMLLPIAALFGGAYLIFVKYGQQIAEAMRRRAEENQRRGRGPRHSVGH